MNFKNFSGKFWGVRPITLFSMIIAVLLFWAGCGISSGNNSGTNPILSDITHGEQLTISDVGPWALLGSGNYPDSLGTPPAIPSEGFWRLGDSDRPNYIPYQTYVYNNDPGNKGGVVPAGGLSIDGVFIPAGTYVVQFQNIRSETGIEFSRSSQGILFRGCRFRGPETAPGFFNTSYANKGRIWIFYCDLGGLGPADSDYHEVAIKIGSAGGAVIQRNYISYVTTGIQILANGYDLTENYIEKLTYYYGPNPPPGEKTDKHINGITLNGGQSCIRILRNKIIAQNPDDAGRTINQTDCISFFQDDGEFPGTGQNSDGTTGYQVKDNYVGGTGYCFYCGKHENNPEDSVRNFVLAGNKITTNIYPKGGCNGPLASEPKWGLYGNVKSNNAWADGSAAGDMW